MSATTKCNIHMYDTRNNRKEYNIFTVIFFNKISRVSIQIDSGISGNREPL